MTPARLPIARSPCLTVPPGLSPSTLLDSPVLLSNMKVEPSPTTGTFLNPMIRHATFDSVGYDAFSSPRDSSNGSASSLCDFEFKPHTRSSPRPGLSSLGSMNLTIKNPLTLVVIERSSEDGYNWRKYGQKLVKGSEFPRSYYKCTHPNCQVKKQFERSYDGHITDIMYKGSHDHPKPQPSRRLAVGAYLPGQAQEHSDDFSALHSVGDNLPNAHGHSSHLTETNGTTQLSPVSVSDDETEGAGTRSNKVGDEPVDDDEDPESKRSEVDILDDGYRWRKYGQKVVKGNPNPRSYYKCTSDGCPVRKHVERAGHDPKAVITTYEGKHNHDVPAARNSSHDAAPFAVSRSHDSSRTTHNPYERPAHTNTISLDLGVGISPSIPKQEATDTEHVFQFQVSQVHFMLQQYLGIVDVQGLPGEASTARGADI
ncbi:putative WRKY transcription factor 20 [Acorus calamus]|uniref:WRKY transcription factor 20 n=1 Tax=Acorus calamus TaxID=4465 RepID=A0AAV9EXS9_ACOCL|nr:putative WRKY transcription factor 20 [Acorus calamus]